MRRTPLAGPELATAFTFRRFTRHHVGTGDYFEELIWTRDTNDQIKCVAARK